VCNCAIISLAIELSKTKLSGKDERAAGVKTKTVKIENSKR